MQSPFKDKRQEESYIVKFVVETQRSYERQTNPDRVKWKTYEELFAGKQDWGPDSDREEWMARCFLHEFAPIIRNVATYIQNTILERSEEIVTLVPPDASGKEMADILEVIIRYFLEEMGFYRGFYDWALCGGIYGFATWKLFVDNKICWKPEVVIERIKKLETKQKSKIKKVEGTKPVIVPDSMEEIERGLAEASNRLFGPGGMTPRFESKKYLELAFTLENVYPLNFFWSPEATDVNKAPVKIERIRKKLFELEPMFENGFLNEKKLDKLSKFSTGTSAGSVNPIEAEAYRVRDQTQQKLEWFPDIEMLEYFGPLTYTNGRLIKENCHFIVANGKHLIRHSEIQTWSRRDPYFTTIFSRRPFKADGVGVADGMASLQTIINDLFSMYVDKLKLDIYAPLAVRTDQLADPTQLNAGITPGAIIETTEEPKKIIAEFPKTSTDVSTPLYQTIEKLSLSGQKAASVNTMTSNPASRARITGTEINANQSEKQLSVNQIVTEVDLFCIQPVVEHTKALVLQYVFNPQVLEQLVKEGVITPSQQSFIMGMPPIERFYEANKNYKLDVKGFRIVLERNDYLMRVGEWMQRLPTLPPEALQMIDFRNVLVDITEAYGFKSDRWLRQLTPHDKAREENPFIVKQMLQPAEDDDDFAELGVHYEALLQNGPVETIVYHINQHIQQSVRKGQNIPPPPPEVAQMLGLPDPKQAMAGGISPNNENPTIN